jgi:hypothetical protein
MGSRRRAGSHRLGEFEPQWLAGNMRKLVSIALKSLDDERDCCIDNEGKENSIHPKECAETDPDLLRYQ